MNAPPVSLETEASPAVAAFLRGTPGATLFHDPDWSACLEAAGYDPRWLVVRDGDAVCGVLPFGVRRRLGLAETVSQPYGTPGGPVVADDDAGVAAALLRRFAAEAGGALGFRMEVSVLAPVRPMLEHVFPGEVTPVVTPVVPLADGFDRVWNDLYDKEVRTAVRQAGRKGIVVARETGSAAVDALHGLHAAQCAAWGVRPLPRPLLARVTEGLGDRAAAWVARGEDGAPQAAALVLLDPGREAIPWVSGASRESRRTKAYIALMNDALRDAAERGHTGWNWGGSVGKDSLASFKRDMGGVDVPRYRVFREAGWFRTLRGLRGGRS